MMRPWNAPSLACAGLLLAGCAPGDEYKDILNGGDPSGGSSTSSTGGGSAPHEWIASALTGGDDCVTAFTYSLPAWLSFKSPTAGRSTQTNESTLCVGFPADAARARSVSAGGADTSTFGLSVESARTNLVVGSDSWTGLKWGTGDMKVTVGAADPANGFAATTFSSSGNQYSNYSAPPILSRVASSWIRGQEGEAPYAHFRHFVTGTFTDVMTTTWKRYSVAQPKDEVAEVSLETRNRPMGSGIISKATSFAAFGAQIEAGAAYPSSYIPTKDAAGTREAESLSSPVPGDLIRGGWLDVELRIAPNYAHDEQQVDHDLLFIDDKNRLVLEAKSHSVALIVGGEALLSDPLTFGRDQELVIVAKSTSAGRELTITGATSGDGMKMSGAAASIPVPPALYLLGNAGGAQECADLRSIKFQ